MDDLHLVSHGVRSYKNASARWIKRRAKPIRATEHPVKYVWFAIFSGRTNPCWSRHDGDEIRRRRNVEIPDIVFDFLEMPNSLTGRGIEGEDAV